MNIYRYIASFFPLSLIFLFSCSKTENNSQAGEIRSGKTSVSFLPEGGTDTISITSTEKWKITLPPNLSWFQLSRDSGEAGVTSVYITAQANITNTPRAAALTINSLGRSLNPVSVQVNQSHDLQILGFADTQAPGGATINILGKGFSAVPAENNVTINGLSAAVQTATHTYLTVTVPFSAGSGPIIVSTGNRSDTSDTDFIYQWVGEVTVIAGGTQGYADGQGTAARFYHPQGIRFDINNNMYVADYANYKVRKITPSGAVTTLPGRIPSWSNPTGPNTDYALPTATAINNNGEVFVVEYNSHSISRFIPPASVALFAGSTSMGNQNGNGTAASFNRPVDIAMDASGNMYIADMDNLCIRKITPNGDVTTFAGGQWGYQDGAGPSARFNRPMGIDADALGNLYVTDYYNQRIRKITPAGMVTTLAGNGFMDIHDGEALSQASFSNPTAIAVASNGIIYVTQGLSHNTIRLIKPNAKVETIISFTEAVSGAPFHFSGIYGIALDRNGILHASDYYNNRICRITYR